MPIPDDSLVLEKGSLTEVSADIFKDLQISKPTELANLNLHQQMVKFDWEDPEFSKFVETSWKEGNQYMHCSDQKSVRYPIKVRNNEYVKTA